MFLGWAVSLGETVTSVNPFGAEMIAFGRAIPKFAGSTFVSDGKRGIRKNLSYDICMVGSSSGLIKKAITSWILFNCLLENGKKYLQFHRSDSANLEDLSEAESAFIDRTDVASQLHCLWRNSKEASGYVPGY